MKNFTHYLDSLVLVLHLHGLEPLGDGGDRHVDWDQQNHDQGKML